MSKPAVFLDRDGVVIREVNYLKRPEQVHVLKGAAEAIKKLRKAGFKVVVITNQSGVGRGYFTVADLKASHARLASDLRTLGAKLDGLYFCPHTPDDGCGCRKPKTLMIRRAAKALGLDVRRSYFVGDTTTDVATALAAGCTPILVRTGKGGRDGKHPGEPAVIRSNLASAARWILARERASKVIHK